MYRLKDHGKLTLWFVFVTVPFYVQSFILVYFLTKSLENNTKSPNQSLQFLVDMFFMLILPLAVIVYSKQFKSVLVLYQFYVQLAMALYSLYVRWRNHSENKVLNYKVDTRTVYYEDTDTLRWVSVVGTLAT